MGLCFLIWKRRELDSLAGQKEPEVVTVLMLFCVSAVLSASPWFMHGIFRYSFWPGVLTYRTAEGVVEEIKLCDAR